MLQITDNGEIIGGINIFLETQVGEIAPRYQYANNNYKILSTH